MSWNGGTATLEVCIDDVAGLAAAVAGGADRVELCSALSLGGLTPAPSLIAAAASAPIPAHMLVRPGEGGFRYAAAGAATIAADIDAAAQAGLAGVAIGASRADRTLDAELLAQLVAHARTRGVARGRPFLLTLHRAFDLCPDLPAALDTAIALGFDLVLTSGGAVRAPDAIETLALLHRRAAGRIAIMAGSGVDTASAPAILATGIRDLHASCSTPVAADDEGPERMYGFASGGRRRTEATRVTELKECMADVARRP